MSLNILSSREAKQITLQSKLFLCDKTNMIIQFGSMNHVQKSNLMPKAFKTLICKVNKPTRCILVSNLSKFQISMQYQFQGFKILKPYCKFSSIQIQSSKKLHNGVTGQPSGLYKIHCRYINQYWWGCFHMLVSMKLTRSQRKILIIPYLTGNKAKVTKIVKLSVFYKH